MVKIPGIRRAGLHGLTLPLLDKLASLKLSVSIIHVGIEEEFTSMVNVRINEIGLLLPLDTRCGT